MNKVIPLVSFLILTLTLTAQNPVPNPSFENWTSGKPQGWTASSNVTQTGPGHTGSYAVKGDKTSRLIPDGSSGFPVSSTYSYLNFYYKFNRVQSEYLSVDVMIFDTAAGHSICSGIAVINTGASTFQAYTLPISCSAGTPSLCDITFGLDINTGSVPASSFFVIDDISLTNSPLAINENSTPEFDFSVYPNPAHNIVNVQTNANEPGMSVEVYNMLGEKVISQECTTGNSQLELGKLPSGLYLFVSKRDGINQVKKIQID